MNTKLRKIVVAAVVLILVSMALADNKPPRYGFSAGNAYQLSRAQQQARGNKLAQ